MHKSLHKRKENKTFIPLLLFGSMGAKGRKEEIVMLYSEEKVRELFDAEKFLIGDSRCH